MLVGSGLLAACFLARCDNCGTCTQLGISTRAHHVRHEHHAAAHASGCSRHAHLAVSQQCWVARSAAAHLAPRPTSTSRTHRAAPPQRRCHTHRPGVGEGARGVRPPLARRGTPLALHRFAPPPLQARPDTSPARLPAQQPPHPAAHRRSRAAAQHPVAEQVRANTKGLDIADDTHLSLEQRLLCSAVGKCDSEYDGETKRISENGGKDSGAENTRDQTLIGLKLQRA